MASHASALKKYRQDQRRRTQNRMLRSRLRTQLRRYRKALEAGDPKSVGGMLSETLSLIDRSAKLGIIHVNAAARTKSRLTLALGRISKS